MESSSTEGLTNSKRTTKAGYEYRSKFTMGHEWEPEKINYSVTRERLTGAAGVGNIVDLFIEGEQYKKFKSCLPVRESNSAHASSKYGLSLLVGFWLGAECLEDVERLKHDTFISKKLGGVPTARSIGSWLRDFKPINIESTKSFLTGQAIAYRNHISSNTPVILDMDSTGHPQSGVKIEGVGWNYKDEWALDSLSCFCNLGFCYGFELREGGAHSSKNAAAMLIPIVEAIKADAIQKEKKNEIFFRADSAFCNEEVIRANLNMSIKFTITAHGNMRWEREASQIAAHEWQQWKYTKEEVEESLAKKRPLPEVQVGMMYYSPAWAENIKFKLVVKRTWEVEKDMFGGYWRYYGVLTNITDYREELQNIIEHHAQRGSAENRIKAMKSDYDLRHLPCLKMNANYAYGLMGMVAMNFHRALSLVENPTSPHFQKSFRDRLLQIPGRLVEHARSLKIKIEERWLEEVQRLRKAWHKPPQLMLTFKLRIIQLKLNAL